MGRREIATLIGSGAFALVVSLIVSAFQVAGVINMTLAHLLIAAAWLVAMIAVWTSEKLSNKSRRHTSVVVLGTGLFLAVLLTGVDRWMVKEKAAQNANAAAANISPSETHIDSTAKPSTSVPEPNPSPADTSEPLDLEPVYKAPRVEVPRTAESVTSAPKDTLVPILESDFDDEVLKATGPVLVFFCTERQDPCIPMAPIVGAITQEYSGRLKVFAVDVIINKNISEKYNAGYFKVPVTVLFKDGAEQGRIPGAASKQSIIRLIEKPQDFKVQTIQAKEPPKEDSDPLAHIPTVAESDFNDACSSLPPLSLFTFIGIIQKHVSWSHR